MAGLCPSCDKVLSSVNFDEVNVKSLGSQTWRGTAFLCPFCRHILSVQIDPIAIKSDLIDELLRRLGRG